MPRPPTLAPAQVAARAAQVLRAQPGDNHRFLLEISRWPLFHSVSMLLRCASTLSDQATCPQNEPRSTGDARLSVSPNIGATRSFGPGWTVNLINGNAAVLNHIASAALRDTFLGIHLACTSTPTMRVYLVLRAGEVQTLD